MSVTDTPNPVLHHVTLKTTRVDEMIEWYADPDGNAVELQADNFGDWEASSEWMRTAPEFHVNPIGIHTDLARLLAAWRESGDAAELHRRSFAGEFDPGTPLDLLLPDGPGAMPPEDAALA